MLKKIRLVWDDGAGCMHPVAGRSRTADSGVAYGMGWMPRLAGWNTSSRGSGCTSRLGLCHLQCESRTSRALADRDGVESGLDHPSPHPRRVPKLSRKWRVFCFPDDKVWTGAISASRNEAQPTVGVAQTRPHTSHHMIPVETFRLFCLRKEIELGRTIWKVRVQ